MIPSGNQRRAPLTTRPTCGTSTATNSRIDNMNSQGAARSQVFIGTWNASNAVTKAMATNIAWRNAKKP